jgi:hypothetical protein
MYTFKLCPNVATAIGATSNEHAIAELWSSNGAVIIAQYVSWLLQS